MAGENTVSIRSPALGGRCWPRRALRRWALSTSAFEHFHANVTSVSNWILRRDDQVGCVVLSSIDHLEGRLPSPSLATRPGRWGYRWVRFRSSSRPKSESWVSFQGHPGG